LLDLSTGISIVQGEGEGGKRMVKRKVERGQKKRESKMGKREKEMGERKGRWGIWKVGYDKRYTVYIYKYTHGSLHIHGPHRPQ
jgi:hypothetical protein